ncbi:MAG TPA: protein kinase [Verrucomicrobiae bacterium]
MSEPGHNQSAGSENSNPSPQHRPPPQISDHTLLRCIGRGAYGEVWLARNVTGSYRAIKIVWRTNFDSPQPFDREFLGLQNYEPISRSHEGLMQVLHVGRNDDAGYFYCVMELADNAAPNQPPTGNFDSTHYEPRTLHSDLRARGQLPVRESLRLALRLSQALAYLHEQSLLHRDLKPSNIIFVKGAPKLADIGLVCTTDSTKINVGTDGYIPPEGSGTPQADIFSLGRVFYEMVTGKCRDQYPDLPTNLRDHPDGDALLEFNEVILKACAADPGQRYQTARELEADLTFLDLGHSVRAKRARQHLNTRLKIAAAGTVLLLIGLFLYSQYSNNRSTRSNNPEHAAEAHSYLQNARILSARSSSHLEGRKNNPRIIEMLEKAVALDPNSAEAHAELALAYTIRLFVYAHEEKDLQEKANLSVERALSLNSNLPAAYLARGRLKWTPFHHFPHEDAIDDFNHALSLDPNLVEARHYRGLVFIHVGLHEQGMRDFIAATESNPSNNGAHYRIGETHLFACRYQRALDKFETIDPDFNPDLRAAHIALALIGLGRKDEALKTLRDYLDSHPSDEGGLVTSVEAIVHALFGREAEAEQAIQRAATRRGRGHFHHTQYHLASAYALLNKKDSALEWFRKSTAEGFNCYPLFLCDTNLDNLRSDPRFTELLADEKKRFDGLLSKYRNIR